MENANGKELVLKNMFNQKPHPQVRDPPSWFSQMYGES
jgi:hypothetical protein